MKRNNKKGFTIVELTIVIAVIAILAAVLIPTFSSVVDKANQSADVQLIRQANVVLQAATADGSSLTKAKAEEELKNNSITLGEPSQSDCVFYYLESENRYVIFNTKTKKATYPEDLAQELSKKNWLPTYELTYDWNLPQGGKTFENGTYMDTGYVIDFGNDFTITETVHIVDASKRVLFLGNYEEGNTGKLILNIGTNNGKLRVYIEGASSGMHQPESKEQIYALEDIVIIFNWDSANRKYTFTAKGEKTNITMSDTVQITDQCSTTMWVGKDRRKVGQDTTFGTITVKSLQITTQYHYGNTVTNPSDPIYNVHNANGKVTATWDKRVTSTTTGDQIITATWSN